MGSNKVKANVLAEGITRGRLCALLCASASLWPVRDATMGSSTMMATEALQGEQHVTSNEARHTLAPTRICYCGCCAVVSRDGVPTGVAVP